MKVLVVGCRGMLGTDLMRVFGSRAMLWGLDLPELDIADAAECLARVRQFQPDVLINAAALTAVDYCESHYEEAFRVNAQGAGNLAAAAASAGSLLVHYSTDYVFDGLKREPYREEDPTGPRSVYGQSKLRGEELVRSLCPDHLTLRTAWLFGRNGKNFIRTILSAAREGRSLRVVDDQRGSPTYSNDLAVHTAQMVDLGCRGIYHLTNGGSCTWYDLAQRAVECAGIQGVQVMPVPTAEYPLPAPRPANSVLANARLEREHLPLMRAWPAAVREYIEQM